MALYPHLLLTPWASLGVLPPPGDSLVSVGKGGRDALNVPQEGTTKYKGKKNQPALCLHCQRGLFPNSQGWQWGNNQRWLWHNSQRWLWCSKPEGRPHLTP